MSSPELPEIKLRRFIISEFNKITVLREEDANLLIDNNNPIITPAFSPKGSPIQIFEIYGLTYCKFLSKVE